MDSWVAKYRFRRVIPELVEKAKRHPVIAAIILLVSLVGTPLALFNDVLGIWSWVQSFRQKPSIEHSSISSPPATPAATVEEKRHLPSPVSSPTPELEISPTPQREITATQMTPAEIIIDVGNAKPMMREGRAKEYVGMRVDWTLSFTDASTLRTDENLIYVALRPKDMDPFNPMGVSFVLPKERIPELKTLTEGDPVRIKGFIQNVVGNWIRLTEPEMTILSR